MALTNDLFMVVATILVLIIIFSMLGVVSFSNSDSDILSGETWHHDPNRPHKHKHKHNNKNNKKKDKAIKDAADAVKEAKRYATQADNARKQAAIAAAQLKIEQARLAVEKNNDDLDDTDSVAIQQQISDLRKDIMNSARDTARTMGVNDDTDDDVEGGDLDDVAGGDALVTDTTTTDTATTDTTTTDTSVEEKFSNYTPVQTSGFTSKRSQLGFAAGY